MPPSRVVPSFRATESEISDRTLFTIVGERATRPDPTARLIAINRIKPDPRQPRKTFTAATLDELAQSIQAMGFLQPLVVRREGENYILISGERRYRAALKLGINEVPVIVREFSEDEAMVAALIENLQRENIPPEEEAAAFDEMMHQRGYGVRELARLIHKDPSYVSRRVRVYQDRELGNAVRTGKLAVSTAERLLSISSASERKAIRDRALSGPLDQKTARLLIRAARAHIKAAPDGEDGAVLVLDSPDEARTVKVLNGGKALPALQASPAAQAIAAIESLLANNVRPSLPERRRLRELNDELLSYLLRLGPMPWG